MANVKIDLSQQAKNSSDIILSEVGGIPVGKIQNVGTGTSDYDAINKQQLEAFLADIFVDKIKFAGDDITDTFDMPTIGVIGTEHVYLNGILQDEGVGSSFDYQASINASLLRIVFSNAPLSGDIISVSYRKL